MDSPNKCCKRQQLPESDEEPVNRKHQKINDPTCHSKNSDNCEISREMLLKLIQKRREDSQESYEAFSRKSSSTDYLKKNYIRELQNDLNKINAVDKQNLVRLWKEKLKLEKKLDEKLQKQEVIYQKKAKAVELSLAMIAAKVQEMEQYRRSQLNNILIQLKDHQENNWEMMYRLYETLQENEELRMTLRDLNNQKKCQNSSSSLQGRESALAEREDEVFMYCTFILICAYILHRLTIDAVQRLNLNQEAEEMLD